MSAKKRGLGRGLDALLTTSGAFQPARQDETTNKQEFESQKNELQKIAIEFLHPGKYQPRKDMSPEALDDLANSIKSQGIIQPIVVRILSENNYEIIAGERRWRAAQLAELAVVPCIIKNVPDEAAVAIALIENIQREDLNAMEEATALQRLMNEFELTHQQTADAVGKSRTTVTNLLRLNNLNSDVKTLLEHGDIEMGHARALLGLEGNLQSDTAKTVVAKGLTVRDTEKLVNKVQQPEQPKTEKVIDPDLAALQNNLTDIIGSNVTISHNQKGKGKLIIDFSDLNTLDGIIERLKNQQS